MKRSEAIEIVREYYPSSGKDLNEALETLIPELKESDDERIRKALIHLISEQDGFLTAINGISVKDIIAWLEKQEEHPRTADSIPLDCTSDAKNENRWHKVKDSLPNNAREVLCKDAIGNFFIGRYYNDGDYWEVSMYDEPDKSNEDNPPVIMWANIPSCEQNLANSSKTCKVEPKFKVGDWVIGRATSNEPQQISEVTDQCYKSTYGSQYGFSFEDDMHLWTIQDAKDGDVLSFNDGHGNDSIELIKSITDNKIEFWFCLTNGDRYEVFDGIIPYTNLVSREDATPATKEQRDFLFQEMKEAGYEWDAEKKELKKIEQKHTPKHRVGDTIYYNSFGELKSMIVANVVTDSTDNLMYEDKEGNAVFEKDIIEQKPVEWSEEDKDMVDNIIKAINHLLKQNDSCGFLEDCLDWLKSLKERYIWKPSNEQMSQLELIVQHDTFADQYQKEKIVTLFNDLKKLKG